jgi:hypothetical protein
MSQLPPKNSQEIFVRLCVLRVSVSPWLIPWINLHQVSKEGYE